MFELKNNMQLNESVMICFKDIASLGYKLFQIKHNKESITTFYFVCTHVNVSSF